MTDDADESRTERRAWIVWGALVAVAVGVYEVFQQPALLGATISLKFAWGDARTGWWLWGRDPDRRRGLAHFWAYFGFGLWKAGVAGIVLSFLFAILDNIFQGPVNNRPPAKKDDTLTMVFAGSCLSGMFMAVASGVVTVFGLVLARRAEAKLWLNSAVAAARVRDLWPPDFGERNRMPMVTLPSALVVVLATLGIGLMVFLAGVQGNNPAKGLIAGGVVATVVVLTVGTLKIVDWANRHLIAASPVEAWPDDPADGGNGP